MIWVMALTRIGDNPDQSPWTMATFAERPTAKVGDTFRFDDEPDEAWLVKDVFADHSR